MRLDILFLTLGLSAGCVLAARNLYHLYQLESYQLPGYFRSVKRQLVPSLIPGAMLAAAGVITALLGIILPAWLTCIVGILLFVGAGYTAMRLFKNQKAKKKLVFTPRVKRLYAVSALVHFLLILLFSAFCGIISVAVYPLLLPLWTAVCGLCALPIEKGINEAYFRDAQHKLDARPDLIKIGITGSYGKTSVKFLLGTMLAEKYQVLVTPSSFNTPMGVTRIIRTKLQPAHQVFVAEMGARHVGDIKELCRLVHPSIGVLTSVGPQHLDTFKTIDRIKNTKYELMDAIPEDGKCFFPDDGAICRELYDRTAKEKHLCSLNRSDDAGLWAEDIRVTPKGSTFTLCTGEGSIPCETRLLGEHNIQNILLAASVCLSLGLTLKQISRGISKLEPVEHRLQLISNPGGMTIIDDAFNSNPRGTEKALKVLAQFPERRIIITPGMVELGEKEKEYNRAFGEMIAGTADIAILVGPKHTLPIREGLESRGFSANAIHVVSSLDEAAALLRRIGRAGDTVLFENDLPDNYQE